MANDRIFIQCKHCRQYRTLVKYYPSHSYVPCPFELADWILEHMKCSPAFGQMDLEQDACFELRTEDTIRNG